MDHWIFLSGMMGTGKSTVARALGAELGVTPVDLDERIVQIDQPGSGSVGMDQEQAVGGRYAAEAAGFAVGQRGPGFEPARAGRRLNGLADAAGVDADIAVGMAEITDDTQAVLSGAAEVEAQFIAAKRDLVGHSDRVNALGRQLLEP